LDTVSAINAFRNTRVMHQAITLNDPAEAKPALAQWITGMSRLWQAVETQRAAD
jgi:hypothetical protein